MNKQNLNSAIAAIESSIENTKQKILETSNKEFLDQYTIDLSGLEISISLLKGIQK